MSRISLGTSRQRLTLRDGKSNYALSLKSCRLQMSVWALRYGGEREREKGRNEGETETSSYLPPLLRQTLSTVTEPSS